jgi:hypothetical protein
MEHIQHLRMTWLRPTAARAEPAQEAPSPELPDRARVRRLAEMHQQQLLQAKKRTGSRYEVLRAQTEALRQFTLELTPTQADAFMNMYTEESSAVERERLSRKSTQGASEPLSATVVNTLTLLATIAAIGMAIFYFLL